MQNSVDSDDKDVKEIENFFSLAKQRTLKKIVDEGIRDYRNGRLFNIRKSNGIWFALFHDNRGSYELVIDLKTYHYSCTCSQPASCKHIVAFSAALKDILLPSLFEAENDTQANVKSNVSTQNTIQETESHYDELTKPKTILPQEVQEVIEAETKIVKKDQLQTLREPYTPKLVLNLLPEEDNFKCVFYNEEDEETRYRNSKEREKWILPYGNKIRYDLNRKQHIFSHLLLELNEFPQLLSNIYIDKEHVELDTQTQNIELSLHRIDLLEKIDMEGLREELRNMYKVSGELLEELVEMVITEELNDRESVGFLIKGKISLTTSLEEQGWQRLGNYLLINRKEHPPKIRAVEISSLSHELIGIIKREDFVDMFDIFDFLPVLKKHKAENIETLPPYYPNGPTPVLNVMPIVKEEKPNELFNLQIELRFAYTQKRLTKKNKQEQLDGAMLFPPPVGRMARNKKRFEKDEDNQVALRKPKKESFFFNSLLYNGKFKKNGDRRVTRNQIENFFFEDLPFLYNLGVEVKLPEELSLLSIKPKPSILDIQSSGIDWFSANIQVEGMDDVSLQEVIAAAKNQLSHVRLKDGRWINVRDLQLSKIFALLESLGIRHNKEGKVGKISKGQATALLLEANIRTEKLTGQTQENLRQWLKQDPNAIPQTIALPSDFSATLRSYQETGVAFLFERHSVGIGAILADDMGLGKTVQGLAFLYALYHQKKSCFLIIVPPAALSVWRQELERFCPSLPWQLWYGADRHKNDLLKEGVIITTYGILQKDMEFLSEQRSFETILIDEAQYLKNHRSLSAQAVRTLQTRTIFCLTGTPLENHPVEIWSLMDLILPGLLGTIKSFKASFGQGLDNTKTKQLRRRITPFILRRTRDEVLKDLPERTVQDIVIPMTKKQTLAYEVCRQEAVQVLNDAGKNYLMKMLPYLMKLRRISCHPSLADKQSDPLASGKIAYLAELADELEESAHGILVFSQFTDMLDLMENFLKERQQKFLRIDGSTTAKKREQRVKQFQEQKDILYFLISLRAGGNAITLHRANTVLHLDPWWNPAVEEQATARAHRMGQKNPVFVYRFFSEQTVEEKVFTLQQKKRKLFDDLFGSETQQSGASFDREELLELLGEK